MTKKLSTSMPLLYIFQPQTTVGESNMQSRYSFKVHQKEEMADQLEAELERKEADSSNADQINEDLNSLNPVAVIEEIPAKIETSAPAEIVNLEVLPPVQLVEENEPEAIVSESNEQDAKKKADPQLVNMFLKTLMPKADEELIKNIQEGNLEALEAADEAKLENEIDSPKSAGPQVDSELKKIISRLARYPNVMKRPLCEAKIGGKKQKFQVESKRGDLVKIKAGKHYHQYPISDFSDFKIL